MRKTFFLLMFGLACLTATAQTTFPTQEGERVRYSASIEMPRGYLSGVCILLREDATIKGSLFNEFGISALDFSYSPDKDKVKLHSVMAMLNKWYIKRVLKKDLRALMHSLQAGETSYTDKKYKIDYRFTLLKDETDE